MMKGNRITIPKDIVKALELNQYAVLTAEENKIVLRAAKVS
jgi:hypothetical protein